MVQNQGVQKKLGTYYTSCTSHSLNLILYDIANTCGKLEIILVIIQRIYTVFTNSTKI